MRNTLLSVLLAAGVSLATACQPASYAPATSGIALNLSSEVEGGFQTVQGRLHITGLDRPLSLHVPVGLPVLEQRLELPPGSYSVSYSPLVRRGAFEPPGLATMKVLSRQPLLLVVAKDQFTTLNVRMLDAADAELVAHAQAPSSSAPRADAR
jgi:hypothetical protein